MDIDQLRGWATFFDKAVIVSLVVTVIAVAALATTTWLSFRIAGTVRAREHAAFLGYKAEMTKHAVALEQELSKARERARELEQAVSAANARAAQAARESATAGERARSAEIDAEEIRKRVAELGKAVREATVRAADQAQAAAAQPAEPKAEVALESAAAAAEAQPSPAAPSPSPAPSPITASLGRYAGTNAALYVLDEAADAPAAGAAISGTLSEAGWLPLTWTWTGVNGIFGVVVLVREGSDRATNDAASALLDALRSAGFNAAKGDWPADWRRYRGTLSGPNSAAPTDAAIRIVVGNKAR